MLTHCRDARFVWNLAVEQQTHWQPGRNAPGYVEQAAQLTEARAEYAWLRAGSQTVQQQALRDFAQAMQNFFAGTHRRPTWRKAGVHDGFRQVAVRPHHVMRLNRRFGRVWVPKVGWLRFRLSRPVPAGVKSYRVTRDRAGRWHIAFAHVPDPICGPGDGSVVGIDRGVAVSAALSTGELLRAPSLTVGEATRLKLLQQRLARAKRGSNRHARTKLAIARLKAREGDRRKNWVEQTTTDIARRFDTICIEALDARAMTRSARGTIEHPGVGVAQKRGLNGRSAVAVGGYSPRGCSTKVAVGSSRFQPRIRRSGARRAGTSLPGTARAKRFSSARPAQLAGATPTSTLHVTSPPDGW